MTICVFLGPTLPKEDAAARLDAIYLPPVQRGDVLSAVEHHAPDTLALVDGHFEQVPAVWHKELLWALSQGIEVWGAASIGALRAAELAQFGMQGVGRIFDAYQAGHFAPFPEPFEDDDEVAVIHGEATTGYISTEAMVDIRATLAAARDDGMIDAAQMIQVAGVAKAIHYKSRTWRAILAAVDQKLGADLGAWLPDGRVLQKRLDAEALLDRLAERRPAAHPPPFRFERTLLWEQMTGPDQRT